MSQLAVVFDTETTGIPDWKNPSEAEHQPHIVEIAATLYSAQGAVIDSFQAIVKPDGRVIPDELAEIHGITQEMAMEVGISEIDALKGFLALHDRAGIRVAHNATFDDRIVRIGLMRYFDEERANAFRDGSEKFCTCNKSRGPVGLGKLPTLAEAYKHFTGEDLVNAHRAMPDAQACARIYFALQGVEMPEAEALDAAVES
ncbi:3'-5' exonuclease [Pseudomonas sp. L-22-4S-12]|uniref:3'-5' exonuclease n=1 Tax=Pseudomonas sp. L-22-4S-12 TaxID=2610893 RepID=UPI001327F81A|nr:3'-5' exonuclease [Pseudomonas sp. L-22-4S-12]MWV17529.1 3'-5' exonuclease [Pseudomonas sp. L-22-4S-12]